MMVDRASGTGTIIDDLKIRASNFARLLLPNRAPHESPDERMSNHLLHRAFSLLDRMPLLWFLRERPVRPS